MHIFHSRPETCHDPNSTPDTIAKLPMNKSSPSGALRCVFADMIFISKIKVVSVALRKVQMGTIPDVEGQLSSFLGMPSCCRRSVLAPLDHIKELSLQWVLMPKLDSRGCIQVTECLLEVRGDTGEGKISKSNKYRYFRKFFSSFFL